MALFLTSLTFAELGRWLREQGAAGQPVLIDNAARALDDGEAIVGGALSEIAAEGLHPARIDVVADGIADLQAAGAILMTGGDPFRLLADLRESGADRPIADAFARGVPVIGQSAGAMVCGPSLAPMTITSPFAAPAGLDLHALGLTRVVVLPHHDRDGRAALHRRAVARYHESFALTALYDDEALTIEEDIWQIRRGRQRIRTSRPEDADGVAEVFHQAVCKAWGSFLGRDRIARANRIPWARLLAIGGRRFLVSEDDDGLTGFVSYRPGPGDDADSRVGEVDVLYTHPRIWGTGMGRRLLDRATWNLLAEGFTEAVLWTEARNERALAMYRRHGWTADGAVDEREYLGVPVRNLRYRLDLTRHAGGP